MNSHRLKIGVLMGGPSSEHAISLKSGHGIVEALTRRGWQVQPLTIPQELTIEQACAAVVRMLEHHNIELAFIALHGPFGEDGTVQQLCETRRIPYTGSDARASRIGMDKVASRKHFEQAGLAVPRWRLIDPAKLDGVDGHLQALRFPVVVKPTNQGSSIGISLATHHAEFLEAVERAARYDTRLLVEEFVRGRELTVGILGKQALPVVEIQPHQGFFDYTAKYTPGQTSYLVPAVLDAEQGGAVQRAALIAHRVVGCRHMSRVDLILNARNEPVVLEVNTIPGFTATSLLPKAAGCAGISYDELCERLVLMAQHAAEPADMPVKHG